MENQFDIQEKSARISDVIEQIGNLNQVLSVHQQHNASPLYSKQYVDMREQFIDELNELLASFSLQVQELNQAA